MHEGRTNAQHYAALLRQCLTLCLLHSPPFLQGVEPNGVTQQLMSVIGQQGVHSVESQQVAAAALSAVFAAAGTMLVRAGMF